MKKILSIILAIMMLLTAVSAFAEGAQVTAQLAADGQSEEGFVAILTADGTVYSQLAVDSFAALIRDFNIPEDADMVKLAVVPDNGEA